MVRSQVQVTFRAVLEAAWKSWQVIAAISLAATRPKTTSDLPGAGPLPKIAALVLGFVVGSVPL